MDTAPLPPLVEPGPEPSPQRRARFHRHTILPEIGTIGQRRLLASKVLVIGAGGLGSPVLLYLTAAGVGTIGIIDPDHVETSNLHRQVIHTAADVGRRKVDSAAEKMAAIDPDVEIRRHIALLDPDNAVELFAQYDLIIDGTDNFATRYLVNDAAALARRPYVWGSILRFEGQVSVFWEHAPAGRAVGYRDLYPTPPEPGTVPSCSEAGVLGALCGTVGSLMATEAVKLICGIGEPLLGRLLCYDALTMSQRTLTVRKDPAAAPITDLDGVRALIDGPERPEPAADERITVDQLAALRGGPDAPTVLDVREDDEVAIAALTGAVHVPTGELLALIGRGADAVATRIGVPVGTEIVVLCKTGIRSAFATTRLREIGFTGARDLTGGIDEWARRIDPAMPRY